MSAETEAASGAPVPRRNGRGRSAAVWVVLVLAAVLLLLSSFAVWINRVALNTSVFTDTSSELLADDAIRNAIATRAVDELFTSVDVEAEIEEQLPENVKSLSGPTTAALRQAAYQIVDRALEQRQLQSLFATTLELSHETLVQVLEGGGPRVSTEGGEVALELGSIVEEVADRIGLGATVAGKIPEDTGRIVVLESNELDTAQSVFQLLKTLAWVLPLLTLAAFALAVWLSRRRRHTVRGLGITIAVVGALGLVAANLTGGYVVDNLVSDRDTRRAADHTWSILTDLLRTSFRWMVVVGLLFVVASWLAGPGRRAIAARRTLAPALQGRAWAYGVLAVVTLVVLLTSEVADATRWLLILVLVALGALWIELTRSQTLHEFPDAKAPAIFADTKDRFSDWWADRRAAIRRGEAPPAASPTDLTASLTGLADLHARGELTDEEYASAKARLLAGE